MPSNKLEIKPNTFYKTRSGEKAFVGYIGSEDRLSRGGDHVIGDLKGGITTWKLNGSYIDNREHDHDLISEWAEELENVDYSTYFQPAWAGDGGTWNVNDDVYPTKEEALEAAKVGLCKGDRYGVSKVGVSLITDIKFCV